MAWLSINEVANPLGSIVVTSSNVSPAAELGGTWTLVDKKFTEYSGSVTATAGAGASSFSAYMLRSDHNIRLRPQFYPSSTVNDTTVTMGKVDLSSCGITNTYYSGFYLPAGSDASNGFAMCEFVWDTGEVKTVDAVGKNGGSLTPSETFYVDFNIVCTMDMMLDSHCKEWHWQRTA